MKRIPLLLLCLITLCSFAQKPNERKYAKLLLKYDVKDIVAKVPKGEPGKFWTAIFEENEEIKDFQKQISKGKKTAKESLYSIMNDVYRAEDFFQACKNIEGFLSVRDSLSDIMGLPDMHEIPFMSQERGRIYLLTDKEVNAFCTPNGDIFVNGGLFEKLKTWPQLIGITAHEIAHYATQHSVIREYKRRKKEKQNEILAGIAFGVSAVGDAMAAGTNAALGKESTPNTHDYSQFSEEAKQMTMRYKFRYSREQEIQADIIAYRFLEWMGLDPSTFAEALTIIDPYIDHKVYATDNHPTTTFRIGLINYIPKYDSSKKIDFYNEYDE